MEAILIIGSVLSTLGVVAIVLSVVVILNRLKGKVDVRDLEKVMRDFEKRETDLAMEISGIMNENLQINESINRRMDDEINNITRHSEDEYRNVRNYIEEVDRRLDSRSDKLYDHIGIEINKIYKRCECLNKNDNKILLKD
tara:strand:+ start:751 stop:1173 length:423 start_codon:yes stop_codon:yes gene_type:complete